MTKLGIWGMKERWGLLEPDFIGLRWQIVERKCRTCERCIRRKARAQRGAKLVYIKVYAPLELVCIDYLSLEPDSSDTRNILVITDYFTKFSWAFPTKDQTAKTVASVLWENLICHFGFPKRIHSDQGANFESELVKELCTLAGVKSRTTPYHPRGNPVERFNRTLLDLLGALSDKKKEHWRKYVRPLVHAYNCTRNDATGESPFLLMFGRQPRLPIDLCFGINPKGYNSKTHTHYVTELKQRLRYAYKLAVQNTEKRQLMNKARWDKKVTAASVEVGDRVLVKNVNIRRKHKIADRWESTVYVVVKQPNQEIAVYVVRPENGDGSERILHRDLLLPCGFLPVSPAVEKEILTVPENCSTRMNKEDLRGDAVVESCGDILEAESSNSLNPHAPEFNLGTVLQNVLELSGTPSVSNGQGDEINSLSDKPVENQSEKICETEIQQDVSSLEEDEDDVAIQPNELSAEEGHDSVVGLRRSKRERKPPNKLNDYVGWKAQCKRQGVVETQPSQISQVLEKMQQQMRVQLTQSELLFSLIDHVSN